MSCPTCDYTLQRVGDRLFHCPRCGTLVVQPRTVIAVPWLVDRCRRFETHFRADEDASLRAYWTALGIEESITPKEEPQS